MKAPIRTSKYITGIYIEIHDVHKSVVKRAWITLQEEFSHETLREAGEHSTTNY